MIEMTIKIKIEGGALMIETEAHGRGHPDAPGEPEACSIEEKVIADALDKAAKRIGEMVAGNKASKETIFERAVPYEPRGPKP